jgi:hypothetical protein
MVGSASAGLESVFMTDPTDGWAVGAGGVIYKYSGGGWTMYTSVAQTLNSVFFVNQNEGWAVGNNATILHYTVTGGTGTWNVVSVSGSPGLSTDANLTSIFMLSPTNGWAVGGISNIGVTDGPVIIYWDGTKWSPVATPTIPGGITATGHTSGILKSVFFPCNAGVCDPNDGWAVGYPGILVANVLHWDGAAWNHVTTSPAILGQVPPILTSVYMTSETSGWIVGGSPDFPAFPLVPASTMQYWAGPGFKQPLSTIMRFGPFGGVATSTVTTVSQISGGTTTTTTTFTTTPSLVHFIIRVVDSHGNPVQGASVIIPALGFSANTGSNGTVTLNALPGTYPVTVTVNGNTETVSVSPSTNGETFLITSPGGAVGPGIPGFPVESIIVGATVGLLTLAIVRRKTKRGR